jgi:pSer/pThr/pTyr-binding forkhead associated (FHA) protein
MTDPGMGGLTRSVRVPKDHAVSADPPPGFYPSDPEPVILPPWAKTSELPRDVIDTRTKKVGRGALQRNPDEPVFFPGRPPKHANADWLLMLADGQRISVTGAVVLGRNPDAVEGYPDATLVSIEDPGKTVSKSHAVLIPYGDGLYIIDLESTNGVAVVADGVRRNVTSTEFRAAPDGSVVELGSYLLGVEKSS